jgi:hypothetical protein
MGTRSVREPRNASLPSEPYVTTTSYLPHVDLLMQALRISRDRLDSRSKIAVDPRLLVHVLRQIVASQPFDESFYLTAHEDVATAHNRGEIGDLHRHFVEAGFLEGRLGAPPEVDSAYYLATYPDVGRAIAAGQIASAEDHYLQRGAAEGRAPNPKAAADVERWTVVLNPES